MSPVVRRLGALLLGLLVLAPAAAAQQRIACQGGFVQTGGQSYACSGVDFLGRLTPAQMGGSATNDIWGWTDPVTGREYALVGLNSGTAFVDVSTPTEPVFLGRLPTHTSNSLWRDIKVYADHAFVVSEASGHGVQVFDLTRLRDVTSPPVTFTEDAHYAGIGNAHNIAINEATGFAYVVGNWGASGCSGGLHMVDIQDPTSPTFAGCFAEDGYTHDVQCVVYEGPDADYQGREVCLASNEDTVTLVDVTDKAAPVMISQALYPNHRYTHQGWLTEDHRYFIADDELDEMHFGHNTRTLVFDVTDLDEPAFLGAYLHPVAATDHNLYVKGRYVYASNYKAGLRILDASHLPNGFGGQLLEQVAYFDTFPPSDASGYDNGTWSNYPFFESGVVVVSDQSGGLFVLQPHVSEPTGSGDGSAAPQAAALSAARPNPFSGHTRLTLTAGAAQEVRVEAFDVLGRRVATLFEGALAAGEERELLFDAAGLPTGTYFVRATGETFAATQRISLVR